MVSILTLNVKRGQNEICSSQVDITMQLTTILDTRTTLNKTQQESAAYAMVSARQGRHLVNTFEVAAIECLTWVAT